MSEKWEKLPERLNYAEPFDELLARNYSDTYSDLVNRWAPRTGNRLILKTDLYDEALCRLRSFAINVTAPGDYMVGMDVSGEIARIARLNTKPGLPPHHYTCNDVRHLPFQENSFELAISDSTLDHFKSRDDIFESLKELHRVLKRDGVLVLALDNSSNITEPLFRAWIALGLSPFYIGPTLSRSRLRKALEEIGFTVTDETAIVHVPRFFGKSIVGLLRKISRNKMDSVITRWLNRLNSLEHIKTRYLTAQFIAVKAVKR